MSRFNKHLGIFSCKAKKNYLQTYSYGELAMENTVTSQLQLKPKAPSRPEPKAKRGVTENTQYLQTSLFSLLDQNQTNCTALYDLAPRFISRVDRPDDSAYLVAIKKDFTFNGEPYRVTVSPARVIQQNGSERDELPGEREQLVEDVIRRMAADCMKVHQDQIEIPFSIYAIQRELMRHGHTFSRQEIKEALIILNKSNIEITKIVEEGSRKPKPLLSAAAYPVLKFYDVNDPDSRASVQLNPLLVQAVKSLAFDQINYDWMMQVKGSLPRWIFKYISLILADTTDDSHTIQLSAAEIARSYGHIRARWRATLMEVEKAFDNLQKFGVIESLEKKEIFNGKRKEDVTFTAKLSDEFMEDRSLAKHRRTFIEGEMRRRLDRHKISQFHPLSDTEAHELTISYNGKLRVLSKAG